MDDATGRAMYKTAGALGMPVGFMLFKGLHLHLPEVTALLEAHPETPAIIDHWGFFHQDGRDVEEAWAQLLALAQYPQVGKTRRLTCALCTKQNKNPTTDAPSPD